MGIQKIRAEHLLAELEFITSRSGGPGGQHVNKVNTKVTLKFDIKHSDLLTEEQKKILMTRLASRITKEGVLIISSANRRSQLRNKEVVIRKLDTLLTKAFTFKKARKRTAPTKAAVQKRLREKRLHAEKKQRRQKPT